MRILVHYAAFRCDYSFRATDGNMEVVEKVDERREMVKLKTLETVTHFG